MTIEDLNVLVPMLQELLEGLEEEKLPTQWVTVRVDDDDVRLFASGRVTINPQKHVG